MHTFVHSCFKLKGYFFKSQTLKKKTNKKNKHAHFLVMMKLVCSVDQNILSDTLL